MAAEKLPVCKKCSTPIKKNKIYCSKKCSNSDPDKKTKAIQTNLRKYGSENPAQNADIKQKVKLTNLERYGVENPSQSNNIQKKREQRSMEKYGVPHHWQNKQVLEKIKQTNLMKYGVIHPMQSEMIKDKHRETCVRRYGVEYPLQSDELRIRAISTWLKKYNVENPGLLNQVKEKRKQTMLERYGVEHNWQENSPIREKIKQTMLERYGVEHHWQKNSPVYEKIKQTMLERYGVEHHWQKNSPIREKIKQTNLEKYGSEYYANCHNPAAFALLSDYDWLDDQYIKQQKSATQIANEINVDPSTVCTYLHNAEIQVRRIMWFSYKAIQWLEYVMQQENIFIQHANNIGEYSIPNTRYLVDGYCKETNTVYEFHGDLWHGNPELFQPNEKCHPFDPDVTAGELYQKTLEKENKIKEMGYNLTIIWELEYEQYDKQK